MKDKSEYWQQRRESGRTAEACRKYRATHPGEHHKRVKLYEAKNPEMRIAYNRLWNAIRTGKIQRLPCHFCSNPKTQAHHADYSKPLEVIWLCALHHRKKHNK